MSKLIIFDFFGVFCTDFVVGWLRERGAVDRAERLTREYIDAADLGHADFDDQCRGFAREFGLDWREVREGFFRHAHFDHAVAGIVGRLQGQARIALLSNAPKGVVERVLDLAGVTLPFEPKVISAEVAMMKPDPAIYRHVLEITGTPASDAIMIDDRPVNIAAAADLGMAGILFSSAAGLSADLRAVGFDV